MLNNDLPTGAQFDRYVGPWEVWETSCQQFLVERIGQQYVVVEARPLVRNEGTKV